MCLRCSLNNHLQNKPFITAFYENQCSINAKFRSNPCKFVLQTGLYRLFAFSDQFFRSFLVPIHHFLLVLHLNLPINIKNMKVPNCIITLFAMLFLLSCSRHEADVKSSLLLFQRGAYPNVIEHDGTFYYTMQAPPPNSIAIWSASSISDINKTDSVMIWDGNANQMSNIWAPELCYINGKWYVYFEADDGNTDNHQLYVLENSSKSPMEGSWTLHGPIITNDEWNYGIHPSSIVVGDRQYLLWSGWEHRRVETETQCIFIAEMENPWTLKSPRIMISKPEYEWERQWINPDGSRTAYPIFVNENPEAFLSPDKSKVIVAYSASGIWTIYNSLGVLYANASSNLLDAASWTKLSEPTFKDMSREPVLYGTSNVTVINTATGESKIIYQAKSKAKGFEESLIFVNDFEWDNTSLPVFGSPGS